MNEEQLTIGQLSMLTGVKIITLRAWERRYGLLKPGRKNSGHRTYSQSDVDKIREIRFWLNQGIAISKVNKHLAGIHTQNPKDNSDMKERLHRVKMATETFNQMRLKSEVDELYAIYPIDFLIEKILPELRQLLTQKSTVSLRFFNAVFRHKLRESIFFAKHSKSSCKLLIARSNSPYKRLDLLSLASILSVYDFNSTVLENPMYIEAIPEVMQKGEFEGLVFFTSSDEAAAIEVNKIADMPWFKLIICENDGVFKNTPSALTSSNSLNSILTALKSELE